jgi:uncharacterized membrane protein
MNISYSFGQMIWIVLVYSFLGWCCEVAFAAVRRGIFVNRGFLNGPVCPIYGFGVLIVLLVLEPVKENLALLFFGSMVLTSALEFFIGFIMEQFFHDKWWDYSENPFNIKGYICLEFSLVWGAACVLVVDVIHPMIFKLICAIPERPSLWLMVFFTAVLITDAIITLWNLLKLPKRLRAIDDLEKAMTAVSDAIGEKVYEGVEHSKERSEAFDEKYPEIAERRKEAFEGVLEKRSEINREVRAREDESLEALRARKAELEKKLEALRKPNLISERIAMAYPKLSEGRHYGRQIAKIREFRAQRKNGGKQ